MTTTRGLAASPPAGDRFARAIERVLIHEGGDADDPRDAGGRTRWGISQRTYPTLNIATLTRAEAIALYRRDFWMPLQGDALPPALAFQALDAAVNHGVGRTVRWLQRLVGVRVDGQLGPLTLAAIQAADQRGLIQRLLALRLDLYVEHERFAAFGRGWTRRIAENLRYAARDLA
jgi:lysozyme family protein